jgi:hypothetical protein
MQARNELAPRMPVMVGVMVYCDALAALLVAAALATVDCLHTDGWLPWALAAAGILAGMAWSLRRLCAWGWFVHFLMLSVLIGLVPLPFLVLTPLLLGWCTRDVRDWFDPPRYREFGRVDQDD